MNNLLKVFIVIFLSATFLQAAAFVQNVQSRDVRAVMSWEQPLSVGSNTIFVQLKGKKYTHAKVRLRAFMPAMPGMPAMKSIADATSLGHGKYKAKLHLVMAGTWQLFIYVTTQDGKHARIKSFLNF